VERWEKMESGEERGSVGEWRREGRTLILKYVT